MASPISAEGASLREALHAEWTKLRTVPSTGWLLLTLIALTVGASALAAEVVKCPASCSADTTKLSITLTAMPRRSTALAAKAAVVTGVVLAAGTWGPWTRTGRGVSSGTGR